MSIARNRSWFQYTNGSCPKRCRARRDGSSRCVRRDRRLAASGSFQERRSAGDGAASFRTSRARGDVHQPLIRAGSPRAPAQIDWKSGCCCGAGRAPWMPFFKITGGPPQVFISLLYFLMFIACASAPLFLPLVET